MSDLPWEPRGGEPILYRPPDGGTVRSGIYSHSVPLQWHHVIYVRWRGHLRVDRRDIFSMPGWREYHALEDLEAEEV